MNFRHMLPIAQGSNAIHALMHRYPAKEINSEHSAEHFSDVCNTPLSDKSLYRNAYARWQTLWKEAESCGQGANRELRLNHRALINLAQSSLWESHTSFNPTYGTPMIPGSACKGLAIHFAQTLPDVNAYINGIFDSTDASKKIQFMDAWWKPASAPGPHTNRPWVREIVTPHHPEFMNTKGKVPATPFDSPKPSPQIAMHGTFLFAVQGPKLWADYALNILQVALENEGIGARTPEYGCIAAPN